MVCERRGAELLMTIARALSASGDRDPYWASVSFLSHVDNSTPSFTDSSNNAFTVSTVGTMDQQSAGALSGGGSGIFRGSACITLPNSSAFDFGSGDFTVELWFLPLSLSGYQGFAGKRDVGPHYGPWSIGLNGSAVIVSLSTSGESWAVNASGGTANLNGWNHAAMVRSGTTVNVWLNGTRVVDTTISGALCTNSYVTAIGDFTADATTAIKGAMSAVNIVKGTAAYSPGATITVPTAIPTVAEGTSALLLFNGPGTVGDAAKKNLISLNGNARVSTTQAKFGPASIAFGGSTDNVVIVNAGTTCTFGTGDFTIEFWAYLSSAVGYRWLYDSEPSGTTGVYPMVYMSDATLLYGTSNAIKITGGSVSTGEWHHIAVARSGTTTKMFLDGSQTGSDYTDSNDYLNPAMRPILGNYGWNRSGGIVGYMDEIRVTKGVARYTANFTPSSKPYPNR